MSDLCKNKCLDNGARKLLKELQTVDFSLAETILYLDVYPKSEKAMAYYCQLKEKREKLIAEYESKYGPITACGNESRSSWDWVSGPWPWELDAN